MRAAPCAVKVRYQSAGLVSMVLLFVFGWKKGESFIISTISNENEFSTHLGNQESSSNFSFLRE